MPRQTKPLVSGQLPQLNKVFREFEGINTQSARQAIKETQFSWLENIMPIGFGNAKVVPAQSAVLATLTGETVYYQHGYNISNVPYMFFACSSGAAYQVNLNTNAKTTIAAAGVFSSNGVQIAQWKNERILIIDSTNYYDWDGTTRTARGGVTGAPSAGQCIATFSGRVWISNNRTINYSAAASFTDFTGNGGNTIISDSTLNSNIRQLLSSNNFLYFFGDDSINVIADVQVVAGVTQFSNTNISANSGTNLPYTVYAYYRSIWYMNQFGVFALYGATPRKVSDDLDGIFQLIDFTKSVSGGTVKIYNIICTALTFTYNDPILGARPVLAIYFNKKWFVAAQGSSVLFMATANVSGVDNLYSVDSSGNVYQLFSLTTVNISTKIQSALWDMGDFTRDKQCLRLGIETNLSPGVGSLVPKVDTENQSVAPQGIASGSFAFTWTNQNGIVVTWTNNVAAPFTWLAAGYVWFQGDAEITGHYLGITITSSTPAIQYSGFQLQYRELNVGWGS